MTTTLQPASRDLAAPSTPRTAARVATPEAPPAQAKSAPAVAPPLTPPAPGRRGWKRALGIAALAVALLGGSAYGYRYWQWAEGHETTDNAFIDSHIVQVSARVSGHVAKVYVDDNQQVHAGDLLLELDPADFQAALDEANGKLVAARADLTASRSSVEEARAQVAAAEAKVAQARADLARRDAERERATQDLAEYTKAKNGGAISATEWGRADTAAQTARATVDAARKAVAAAEADAAQNRSAVAAKEGQVAVAEAGIKTAQAAVEKARLNLSYTKVAAASDGRVTRKSVEPGNFLLPGQPLMALVSPELWVTANFKETQLAAMTPGQKVEIDVDAYPGMTLRGHVDSIQQGAGARFSLLPPENATGNYVKVVQRVPVKIVIDELPQDGRTLGPGMSVVPVVSLKK